MMIRFGECCALYNDFDEAVGDLLGVQLSPPA